MNTDNKYSNSKLKSEESVNQRESAIQTMNKYPKYKSSGVEWIGEIPEHWDVKRLKYIVNYTKGKNPKELTFDEKGKVYLTMEYLRNNPKQVFFVEDFENYVNVDENEILLLWDGSNAGEFIKSKEGILSSTMASLKIRNQEINYAWYFFKEFERKLRDSTIGMGVPHVNGEELKNQNFIIPPKPEQTAIANFLDEKTSQIDKLITNKQKLIELLKAEHTAVINQAVTRGIKPNVKLKPSGIEWLGNIPEHWDMKKLKHIANIQSSNVDKKSFDDEIEILLCNYNDVYKNEFIDYSFNFMKATATDKEIDKFILKQGDVLITKDSETPDDIANPAFVTQDFDNVICGYHLAHIRTNKNKLLGEFLFRLFQSKKLNSHFEVSANGVTRYGLPLDSITDVKIPFPSIEEQHKIVQHIETETKRIDTTISKIEKEIELLQEYRTALISEVVTGKLCVYINHTNQENHG